MTNDVDAAGSGEVISVALRRASQAIALAAPHWSVVPLGETGSTNDEARRLVDLGVVSGPTVILADSQTAGRGRVGARWEAPVASSVLASFVVRVDAACDGLASLWPIRAGVAAAGALESLTGLPVDLKWPNDLLLNGGKVGGILIEQTDPWMIVGIGVNVLQGPSELPQRAPGLPPAASLATVMGAECPPRELAIIALVAGLASAFEAPLPAPVAIGAWQKHWRGKGAPVRVPADGGAWIEARACEIDSQGFLLAKLPSGAVVRLLTPTESSTGAGRV